MSSNLKDGFSLNPNKLHVSNSFEQNEFLVMNTYKFQNKPIVSLPHHATVFPNYTDKIVYSANPINVNAFVHASRVELNIPARSNDVLMSAPWLIVRISETNGDNVSCAPFHLWFDRIEVMSRGQIINTYCGDDLYFYNLAIENDKEEREITDVYGNVATNTIAAFATAKYMIKLPFNVNQEIFLHGLVNDIKFVFYTRNCVESGSGVIACNELSLVFNHKHLHTNDRIVYANTYDNHALMRNVCECLPLRFSIPLTQSQKTKFSLRQLGGHSFSHLVIQVTVGSSNASIALATFSKLHGTGSNIELISPNNNVLLLNGYNMQDCDYYRSIVPLQSKVNSLKYFIDNNSYLIAFSKDLMEAHDGFHNSSLYIQPTEEYSLEITPYNAFGSNIACNVNVLAYIHKKVFIANGDLHTQL